MKISYLMGELAKVKEENIEFWLTDENGENTIKLQYLIFDGELLLKIKGDDRKWKDEIGLYFINILPKPPET